MAGSLTQWGEELLLRYVTGNTASITATNIPSLGLYLGLALDENVQEIGQQAAFVEASYSGYYRSYLQPAQWSTVSRTSEATTMTYQPKITLPNSTSSSLITVRYLVLYTQPTGGSPIWYSAIEQYGRIGRILELGDVLEVPAQSIILSLN